MGNEYKLRFEKQSTQTNVYLDFFDECINLKMLTTHNLKNLISIYVIGSNSIFFFIANST